MEDPLTERERVAGGDARPDRDDLRGGRDEAPGPVLPEPVLRAVATDIPAVTYVESSGEEPATLHVSGFVERLLGYAPAQWADPSVRSASLHPADRARVSARAARAAAAGEECDHEYRLRARDGRIVWVRDRSRPVSGADGGDGYRVGLIVDVTSRHVAEERLSDAELRYRTLVEQIPAITYTDLVDEAMTTTYISPQVESLLGIGAEEWIADPDLWRRHLHHEDRDRTLAHYLTSRERGERFVFEYRMVARDGRVVWFRDDAVVVRDGSGAPRFVHGVMLDITERRRAEEQAEFLAYHDSLTGLPNRTMLEELLGRALARARRHDLGVAVLSVNVDEFKLVNDGLGREAGDELIRLIARRLEEATRETDLVARPGGDEFTVLLADLERGRGSEATDDGPQLVAESVAARIAELLESPFVLGDQEIFTSASIGISVYPTAAADARGLLQTAEVAMHRSKRNGPGGVVVFRRDESSTASRLSMAARLRRAVERQSWILHYQPIVDLEAAAMREVEALIRWQDPNGGLVPPGEFIPLAEEMGLIEAIGDWVLRELCLQIRRWQAAGVSIVGGFNLSLRQLWQPDVAARILATIEGEGLSPSRVVVEVTESSVMADPDRTVLTLRELHAAGLRIAIDDFGTGYSSLSRLSTMPVDVLKIDRSFIRDIPEDRDSRNMVRAIVQLASSLGIAPLAEGIETEAQRRFLVDNGCRLGQGYHFSRPVTADRILAIARGDVETREGVAG